MQKADFLGKLKLKQILWNFVQQLNTQHIFHPLTQNTIKALKSRGQAFLVCWKTPAPGLQNLSSRPKEATVYIFQKLINNSWGKHKEKS
jgi:hypothetical protein